MTLFGKLRCWNDPGYSGHLGAKDPVTGEYTIFAVASNIFTSYEKEILQIKGTRVEKVSTRETTALAQGSYVSVAVKGDWFFAV